MKERKKERDRGGGLIEKYQMSFRNGDSKKNPHVFEIQPFEVGST